MAIFTPDRPLYRLPSGGFLTELDYEEYRAQLRQQAEWDAGASVEEDESDDDSDDEEE